MLEVIAEQNEENGGNGDGNAGKQGGKEENAANGGEHRKNQVGSPWDQGNKDRDVINRDGNASY